MTASITDLLKKGTVWAESSQVQTWTSWHKATKVTKVSEARLCSSQEGWVLHQTRPKIQTLAFFLFCYCCNYLNAVNYCTVPSVEIKIIPRRVTVCKTYLLVEVMLWRLWWSHWVAGSIRLATHTVQYCVAHSTYGRQLHQTQFICLRPLPAAHLHQWKWHRKQNAQLWLWGICFKPKCHSESVASAPHSETMEAEEPTRWLVKLTYTGKGARKKLHYGKLKKTLKVTVPMN